MATYNAIDGLVQDFHLVHLGARVLGGAGLVMVEMTASSPDGRITPACTSLWTDVHGQAFGRIVDFVHASGRGVRIGLQRRHSGPTGSTQLGWARPDEPLAEGNWPLLAASAVAYGPTNQTLQAMTRHDMDRVTADFVSATRHAARVGFD